ncbi:hypothetical protein [Pseudomonas faucium]|uniref:hypothetical protein n=1 Tax=Pseudomonas faucium TaxID=2740518 RepID=UPI001F2ADB5C|nr:hypothetical protein [Pseudomonas faucium]
MDDDYTLQGVFDAIFELLMSEGRVLLGALLGALLVSAARDPLHTVSDGRLSVGKHLMLMVLTLGVGYLFEPLLQSLAPMLSRGMAAFVAAVVVIPITLKVLVWLDTVEVRELIQRWRRRG